MTMDALDVQALRAARFEQPATSSVAVTSMTMRTDKNVRMMPTRNYTGLHILPFGMICEWDDQLLQDGGHGRLIHEPTLGPGRQLVKRRRWPKLTGVTKTSRHPSRGHGASRQSAGLT